MSAETEFGPRAVVERLNRAINDHDIESFVGCFDRDYESEQPAHPTRRFTGQDQVRENWSNIFASIPDLSSRLLSVGEEGQTVLAEWQWQGTQAGGEPFDWRGVTVMGIRGQAIVWGRLYMEPVEHAGADIAETVRKMTGTQND